MNSGLMLVYFTKPFGARTTIRSMEVVRRRFAFPVLPELHFTKRGSAPAQNGLPSIIVIPVGDGVAIARVSLKPAAE